jgi:sulfhydrogenase subunit delta
VSETGKPKLAVWKFASCDGCQLSLLDLEDELLALAGAVELAEFREATSGVVDGPYDLSLVEGSVTTAHDAERIQDVRRASKALVTIGACATSGGIQALRNFADVREFTAAVYASPEYISTLETSTPISAHVRVDFELHGCPINKRQLLEVVTAFLHGRKPGIPSTSVCTECKKRGIVCVTVAHRTPRRLRRALPRLQPRLLWLLRTDGDAEHRSAHPAVARPRAHRARRRARVPDLQRECSAVPRGGGGRWLRSASSARTTSHGSRARAR